jgi:hypothetical protein
MNPATPSFSSREPGLTPGSETRESSPLFGETAGGVRGEVHRATDAQPCREAVPLFSGEAGPLAVLVGEVRLGELHHDHRLART